MRVLGFAGYSGSGKTTLLEKLIPRLTARGLRVAVVKHTHHDVDWDTPGKDSWRHRQAGATKCCWPRPAAACWWRNWRTAMICRWPPTWRCWVCDLVLAEGFKHEAIPKIEVVNSALAAPALHLHDGQVLAVVGDLPQTLGLPGFTATTPTPSPPS